MKYLFVDLDGTIIWNIPYSVDLSKIELLPQAVEGLLAFQKQGYLIIIVTNQSGIALGKFSHSDYCLKEFAVHNLLESYGIKTTIIHCPHKDEDNCICRKPKPGMIELYPERTQSVMIGDKPTDIQAGEAAGLKSYLTTKSYTILDIAKDFFDQADELKEPVKRKYNKKIKQESNE